MKRKRVPEPVVEAVDPVRLMLSDVIADSSTSSEMRMEALSRLERLDAEIAEELAKSIAAAKALLEPPPPPPRVWTAEELEAKAMADRVRRIADLDKRLGGVLARGSFSSTPERDLYEAVTALRHFCPDEAVGILARYGVNQDGSWPTPTPHRGADPSANLVGVEELFDIATYDGDEVYLQDLRKEHNEAVAAEAQQALEISQKEALEAELARRDMLKLELGTRNRGGA